MGSAGRVENGWRSIIVVGCRGILTGSRESRWPFDCGCGHGRGRDRGRNGRDVEVIP